MTADEASAMDPHHKLLLECTLEAAEGAGLTLPTLGGSNTGVFSGIGSMDFCELSGEDAPASTRWSATCVAFCMFANRLSYFFSFTRTECYP